MAAGSNPIAEGKRKTRVLEVTGAQILCLLHDIKEVNYSTAIYTTCTNLQPLQFGIYIS